MPPADVPALGHVPGDRWGLYAMLGVSPWDSLQELERARRRLVSGLLATRADDRDARISRINVAFQILSNPISRQAYDAGGGVLCPYCGHLMPRRVSGWTHLRLHTGVGSNPNACERCRRTPTRRFSFRTMLVTDDAARRRYQWHFDGPLCRWCSFRVHRSYEHANWKHWGGLRGLPRATWFAMFNRAQSVRRIGLAFPASAPSTSPIRDFLLQAAGGFLFVVALGLFLVGGILGLRSDGFFPGPAMMLGAAVVAIPAARLRWRIRER